MSDFWNRIESRRKALKMSRAELCRRANISNSTADKGLKNGSKPVGAIRKQVELVIAMAEQLQRDGDAEARDDDRSIADLAQAGDQLEQLAADRRRGRAA